MYADFRGFIVSETILNRLTTEFGTRIDRPSGNVHNFDFQSLNIGYRIALAHTSILFRLAIVE